MTFESSQTAIAATIELLRADPNIRAATRFCAPAGAQEVEAVFSSWSVRAPDAVRQFYALTNGLWLGTFEIASLDEVLLVDTGLVMLHNWGTGDADCLRVGPGEKHDETGGPVVFVGHDPPLIFEVAPTFATWLRRIVEEFIQFGEVCDPMSCHRMRASRTYSPPDGYL